MITNEATEQAEQAEPVADKPTAEVETEPAEPVAEPVTDKPKAKRSRAKEPVKAK